MQYKILFKMYDQDGDGVIGQEELTALLFEISKQKIPALSKSGLEAMVQMTIQEFDKGKKLGLNFREFKAIFDNHVAKVDGA